MRGDPCPACGAPLALVWVHGHGQCALCATTVVPCCMGAGQEIDEREAPRNGVLDSGVSHAGMIDEGVTVEDVVQAFARCSSGGSSVTVDALVLAITAREDCTLDAATSAIDRAVTLKRLALAGRVARLPA